MILAIKALLEVVESGSKNIEIAVMRKDSGLTIMTDEAVDALVATIEAQKAEADAKKKPATAAS